MAGAQLSDIARRRERLVDIEFELDEDRRVYAGWIPEIVDRIFGHRMDRHNDLYELTHLHRMEQHKQAGGGPCEAWPSPPARAPMWYVLADMLRARRFLEVGCGLGYTAALMATASGPESRVDTIEIDSLHAELAERELSRKGLADRVRVLRGDLRDILPSLTEPYDVVFEDAGGERVTPHLTHLVREGGVLMSKAVKRSLFDEVEGVLARARARLGKGAGQGRQTYTEAEAEYRTAVASAIKTAQNVGLRRVLAEPPREHKRTRTMPASQCSEPVSHRLRPMRFLFRRHPIRINLNNVKRV